ncbi:MAG TPA: AAA family ATPase [Thermoanaerobaculia bacterium]|nr:AAA family ATPase [Thermoanaerobaculia bacterium]
MKKSLTDAAAALRLALSGATRGLVEREALAELIALAAVAGEHVLVIGPPGTAKSEAVRRIARSVDARLFEYLLGRFTEPSEIFGPIDLRRLKEGFVETETAGMLPEAELAFLDEVFKGSTAILNTLLSILNERVFRRGHTLVRCPLRVCVGASNALPEDESLAAFSDRFLVRVFVDPVPDPRLEELLEAGWSLDQDDRNGAGLFQPASLADLDTLTAAARQADLSRVRPHLAHAIRLLRASGIVLSDRRAVRVQGLVAAAAALAGRSRATDADLWPLVLAVPTREQQSLAREVLAEVLAQTENATLPAAAEEASLGPLARAARIAAAGRDALREQPRDDEELEDWLLRLEGIAREIDAGFSPETLPPDLSEVRARIVEALRGAPMSDASAEPDLKALRSS